MTTTATARTNTYAGQCSNCGQHVAAQAGRLSAKVAGRWTVECGATCTIVTPEPVVTRPRPAIKAGGSCAGCGGTELFSADLSVVCICGSVTVPLPPKRRNARPCCDQCGTARNDLREARDGNGVVGKVCRRCQRLGDLSFA